jgi:hypothetical protein
MRILAYIDPGAGALIWQSIIGIFVGVIFYLRRTRKWVSGIFARFLRTETKDAHVPGGLPAHKSKAEANHINA